MCGSFDGSIARSPSGSSLWYARLIYDRMIVDNVRRMTDPNYAQSFQRAKDNAQKLYGQQFWRAPGAATPSL